MVDRYNKILDCYNGLEDKYTFVDNLVLADVDFLFELSMSVLLTGRMLLSLRIYNGLLFRYRPNGLIISYNGLVDRYRKILHLYNELVDCYNELVDCYTEIRGRYNEIRYRFNGLVDRYNGLVGRYNGIVDRYN